MDPASTDMKNGIRLLHNSGFLLWFDVVCLVYRKLMAKDCNTRRSDIRPSMARYGVYECSEPQVREERQSIPGPLRPRLEEISKELTREAIGGNGTVGSHLSRVR